MKRFIDKQLHFWWLVKDSFNGTWLQIFIIHVTIWKSPAKSADNAFLFASNKKNFRWRTANLLLEMLIHILMYVKHETEMSLLSRILIKCMQYDTYWPKTWYNVSKYVDHIPWCIYWPVYLRPCNLCVLITMPFCPASTLVLKIAWVRFRFYTGSVRKVNTLFNAGL